MYNQNNAIILYQNKTYKLNHEDENYLRYIQAKLLQNRERAQLKMPQKKWQDIQANADFRKQFISVLNKFVYRMQQQQKQIQVYKNTRTDDKQKQPKHKKYVSKQQVEKINGQKNTTSNERNKHVALNSIQKQELVKLKVQLEQKNIYINQLNGKMCQMQSYEEYLSKFNKQLQQKQQINNKKMLQLSRQLEIRNNQQNNLKKPDFCSFNPNAAQYKNSNSNQKNEVSQVQKLNEQIIKLAKQNQILKIEINSLAKELKTRILELEKCKTLIQEKSKQSQKSIHSNKMLQASEKYKILQKQLKDLQIQMSQIKASHKNNIKQITVKVQEQVKIMAQMKKQAALTQLREKIKEQVQAMAQKIQYKQSQISKLKETNERLEMLSNKNNPDQINQKYKTPAQSLMIQIEKLKIQNKLLNQKVQKSKKQIQKGNNSLADTIKRNREQMMQMKKSHQNLIEQMKKLKLQKQILQRHLNAMIQLSAKVSAKKNNSAQRIQSIHQQKKNSSNTSQLSQDKDSRPITLSFLDDK